MPRRREAQHVVHALAPDPPEAVQPSFSQCSVRVSSPSSSHAVQRAACPSAENARCGRTPPASQRDRWAATRARSAVPCTLGWPRRYVARDRPRRGLSRARPAARSTPVDLGRRGLGLVLAADVVAVEDVPPFANSAVDGYAVRAADVADAPTSSCLRSWARSRPARLADRALGAGEAIRIMTGAPMPPGADAVVMVEDTDRGRATACCVGRAVADGASVRGAGDDIRLGDDACSVPGAVDRARRSPGCSPASTCATVPVIPRPRVAVLSTGDELVDDGRPLAAGPDPREQQDDAARPRRRGRVRRPSTRRSSATTRPSSKRCCARPLDECDAIVTSGGVSMGDYDVVKAVLVADRRHALDADRHQAGQAVRVRAADRAATADARVRPAGQPGQLAGQLRAARPAGAAQDDGPPVAAADRDGRRPSPTSACAAAPTARRHYVRVNGRVRGRRPLPRAARRRPGQPPAGCDGAPPTRSPSSPDGDGVAAGGDVDVVVPVRRSSVAADPTLAVRRLA